jgi:hypothetical protein
MLKQLLAIMVAAMLAAVVFMPIPADDSGSGWESTLHDSSEGTQAFVAFTVPVPITTRIEGDWTVRGGLDFVITEYRGTNSHVVIPSRIALWHSIGSHLFAGRADILSVNIPVGISDIWGYAFEGTSITSITLPRGVRVSGYSFAGANKLTEFVVDENHTWLSTIDGVLFNKRGTQIVAYPGGRESHYYTVPASIDYISEYAFGDSPYLTTLFFTSITPPRIIRPSISHNALTALVPCVSLQAYREAFSRQRNVEVAAKCDTRNCNCVPVTRRSNESGCNAGFRQCNTRMLLRVTQMYCRDTGELIEERRMAKRYHTGDFIDRNCCLDALAADSYRPLL